MFHRNLNSEFLSDRAGLRLITFQCYKCPSISSFLWIFTLWGGSGGKKRIYSAAKWRPADGHRQISHHIILFVWNLFILFFNKMYLHIKPSTKSFMFHPVINCNMWNILLVSFTGKWWSAYHLSAIRPPPLQPRLGLRLLRGPTQTSSFRISPLESKPPPSGEVIFSQG